MGVHNDTRWGFFNIIPGMAGKFRYKTNAYHIPDVEYTLISISTHSFIQNIVDSAILNNQEIQLLPQSTNSSR